MLCRCCAELTELNEAGECECCATLRFQEPDEDDAVRNARDSYQQGEPHV